jgi:hypothetical protein
MKIINIKFNAVIKLFEDKEGECRLMQNSKHFILKLNTLSENFSNAFLFCSLNLLALIKVE